jgi:hypothetical protein
MKKYNFLAFDIGATSGRAVLGTLVGDKFEMQELHRFPNAIMELHGKYYWDIYRLYDALKESLTICARRNLLPDSIGIDTWGWISGIWRKTVHCWAYRVRIAILIRTVRRKSISSVFPGRKSTGLPAYRS